MERGRGLSVYSDKPGTQNSESGILILNRNPEPGPLSNLNIPIHKSLFPKLNREESLQLLHSLNGGLNILYYFSLFKDHDAVGNFNGVLKIMT